MVTGNPVVGEEAMEALGNRYLGNDRQTLKKKKLLDFSKQFESLEMSYTG